MNYTVPKFLIAIALATIAAYLVALNFSGEGNLHAGVTHVISALIAVVIYRLTDSYFEVILEGFKNASTASSSARENGEVKWFNGSKGFGFISYGNEQEIFVHFRSVRSGSRRLSPGKPVEFSIGEGKKGPEAVDVLVVD